MYKLSICIPTYNRSVFLNENLEYLTPQIKDREDVEVIVIDNASEDDTKFIVTKFMKSCPFLKYFRNQTNLGYAGNQVKCFEYSSGDYIAILCDDDAYIDGQVETILKVISNQEYAFVALNYYSFINDIKKPYKSNFAPEHDVVFTRAYDIMNYPSVGHFSGFIFNSKLAKETLTKILAKRSYEIYERNRGIINDIAVRSTLASELPAYFIGKRGLATRVPKTVDYDTLYHQCIDYYDYYYSLFIEGLITRNDLDYRGKLVLDRLPRAIVSNGPQLSSEELQRINNQLSQWFKGKKKFDVICLPLLYALKYKLIKQCYKIMTNLYRFTKVIRKKILYA